MDAKRPGAALRRKTLWKKHKCLPVPQVLVGKAGVDLGLPTWIFTHQPDWASCRGCLLVSSLQNRENASLMGIMLGVADNMCATSSGCSYAINTYSVPSCLLSSEKDRTLLLRPPVHFLACGRCFIHIGSRKQQIIVPSVCVLDSLQPHEHNSLPGFYVHGILQAGILEWIVIPFSRESSRPSDQTLVCCNLGRFFTI